MTPRLPVGTDPAAAAAALLAGGLVVLPTETVYGLGADADDPRAVARVYAVKGRPADHPLIVHLGSAAGMSAWARAVPEYARRLADGCWPGPLTLVLPRSDRAGDHVTGGQDTVALRVPGHRMALAVLAALDDADPDRTPHGIAAPSANRFGRVSPTTAAHARAELGDALDPTRDLVLDGGPCPVGVESTIVDCTGPRPRLLRPGGIGAAEVAAITGLPLATGGAAVRAPGTLASHYAPRARVVVVEGAALTAAATAATGSPEPARPLASAAIGLLALADVPTPPGMVRLSAPDDATAYARVLYASLREADALRLDVVLAIPPAGDGLAEAVADRLARAATPP